MDTHRPQEQEQGSTNTSCHHSRLGRGSTAAPCREKVNRGSHVPGSGRREALLQPGGGVQGWGHSPHSPLGWSRAPRPHSARGPGLSLNGEHEVPPVTRFTCLPGHPTHVVPIGLGVGVPFPQTSYRLPSRSRPLALSC